LSQPGNHLRYGVAIIIVFHTPVTLEKQQLQLVNLKMVESRKVREVRVEMWNDEGLDAEMA